MRGVLPGAVERARRLRRNETEAERKLWWHLRARKLDGAKFRRQFPIGPYVVDFCCREALLIVELDGGQHAQDVQRDAERTSLLQERGYRVMRFWNNEVLLHTEAVLESIRAALSWEPQE